MATEKRLINADAIANGIALYLAENAYLNDTAQGALEMVANWVNEAPTVDAVEVAHGWWNRCGGDLHSSGYAIFCSVCNKTHFVHYKHSLGGLSCEELFEKPKYCPSCGAVMESEE